MIQRDQYRKNPRAVLVLPAVVLSLLLAESAGAQKAASKPSVNDGNLQRCLEGLPSCDVSRLKPEDIGRISAASRSRNVGGSSTGGVTRYSRQPSPLVPIAINPPTARRSPCRLSRYR